MAALKDYFSKYTGYLRRLKLVYIVNNLLNGKKLSHNKELYEKYGIKKSIYQSIGKKDFEDNATEIPWIDQPGAKENLKAHPDFKTFPSNIQQQLLHFIDNGFMVLKGFYSEEEVDILNEEVDRLLEKNKVDFNYTGRKLMDAFRTSSIINKAYFRNEKLLRLLNFAMGRNVVPFQTINFIEGSEQRAHSDSIHMTTQPLGYLIATWTALEDLHEGNGPLFYYPGSHRLPYITCQDYLSGHTKWQLGSNSYKKYEDKIEAVIAQEQLQKTSFLGKKGDVFIWHANLLHGGSSITQEGATRKSMVAHYFCENVICYHEISQRPALLELD